VFGSGNLLLYPSNFRLLFAIHNCRYTYKLFVNNLEKVNGGKGEYPCIVPGVELDQQGNPS